MITTSTSGASFSNSIIVLAFPKDLLQDPECGDCGLRWYFSGSLTTLECLGWHFLLFYFQWLLLAGKPGINYMQGS